MKFISRQKVEFYDVDSMDVVYHGNYVRFLERARCELLDAINYNYLHMKRDGFAYPIVKMDFKFIRPARFGDMLEIHCEVADFTGFLRINYEIFAEGILLTRASTSQMAFDIAANSGCLETNWALQQAFLRAGYGAAGQQNSEQNFRKLGDLEKLGHAER